MNVLGIDFVKIENYIIKLESITTITATHDEIGREKLVVCIGDSQETIVFFKPESIEILLAFLESNCKMIDLNVLDASIFKGEL